MDEGHRVSRAPTSFAASTPQVVVRHDSTRRGDGLVTSYRGTAFRTSRWPGRPTGRCANRAHRQHGLPTLCCAPLVCAASWTGHCVIGPSRSRSDRSTTCPLLRLCRHTGAHHEVVACAAQVDDLAVWAYMGLVVGGVGSRGPEFLPSRNAPQPTAIKPRVAATSAACRPQAAGSACREAPTPAATTGAA